MGVSDEKFGQYRASFCQRLLLGLVKIPPLYRGFLRPAWIGLLDRIRPGPLDISSKHGLFRMHPATNGVEAALLLHPDYNSEEIDFLKQGLNGNSTFLDIGANTGLYSVAVGKHLGDTGRVVAIEPNRISCARLHYNLAANGIGKATVVGVAAGYFSGRANLVILKDDLAIGRTVRADVSGEIEVQPLLTILDRAGVQQISALKIDIEEDEQDVLETFFTAAPVERWPRRICIRRRGDKEGILSVLERCGYELVRNTRKNSLLQLQSPRADWNVAPAYDWGNTPDTAVKSDPLTPRISVCIPTYNYARFLPEAIESILNQNFTDFELLIIDDCSKDNTSEVVQKYAARDARIRFQVNSPNIGMVNNWNLCIHQARGEFIKFVFGDDLLTSPDALKKMLTPLVADPSISLVATARKLIDPGSQTIRTRSSFGNTTVLSGPDAIRLCLLEQKNLIGEPTVVLFRKADALRGFNKNYRQIVDLEMWYHLLEKGRLAYLNEPLCAFRCHPDQQTEHNSRSNATLDDTTLLLEEYLSKPYLNFRWSDRVFVSCDFCYQVWKSARQNKISHERARAVIEETFGYSRFRMFLPLYKIVRPCRKLVRHLARKSASPAAEFKANVD